MVTVKKRKLELSDCPSGGHSANRLRHVVCWSVFPTLIWKGVLDYAAKLQNWRIQYIWELPDDARDAAQTGDGILFLGKHCENDKRLSQLRVPVVVVEPNRCHLPFPWVGADNVAVGIMAAEHLLERGLRQFGFLGAPGWIYADERHDGYVQRLQQAGFTCSVCFSNEMSVKHPQVTSIAQWLSTLPTPVGILAISPYHAGQLLAACNLKGLRVPEDVAIIATKWSSDTDQPDPLPLSFVKLNDYVTGMEAAALLNRLMSGAHEPPGTAHRIAPLGVETRQSTDMLAIPDTQVAAALRYIWQHACEGIQVKDVLQSVPLSRRVFEKQFKQIVGRTPHEEIDRVQMNRAKELLIGTNLSIQKIAERLGFTQASYLVERFHLKTGMTPAKYRAKYASLEET